MITLRSLLEDYLTTRRALGFKLHSEGTGLKTFVSFMEQRQADFITTELALAWAQLPTSVQEMQRARRLGFVRSFARSQVDVDYHIAMGGRAYGTLARSLERSRRRALAQVFAELAAKFQPLVDALSEISDAAYVYTQRDILRLYEIWLKTGSERARGLLRRLGVEAAPVALRLH